MSSQSGEGSSARRKLVIAGPFASVSHPLVHMIQSGKLGNEDVEYEFRMWKDVDQLRAMLLDDQIDFAAIPTNVAANLYNKGLDIRLVNVSIWGILGMMTRDEELRTLKDFKGKKIVVPFRADMPDIVFRELIKAQGMDPDKDFELSYVSSPIDAMQMLMMRRVDHVLLAEPAISMALRKSGSFPLKAVAPTLFRSTDLQEEWAQTFNTDSNVPQAGMAVIGDVDSSTIERFNKAYSEAVQWYLDNPAEAGRQTAEVFTMLNAEAIADSIPHVKLKSVSAAEARGKLEEFFRVLYRGEPKLIGGKLPDADFYFGVEKEEASAQE
ncbi:MAG: ABC transporter substrate-binding protein [Acidobacteria bacterium]|nr:MAG: ABC transporter substrate-binding protein [Acidobacteriota bacterium]PIE91614.1 MAG: ABC transporter substrate-binding protein [Acidobacteriota bacterium]